MSHLLFARLTFPFPAIVRRGHGPHLISSLSSKAQSARSFTQSTSSSKESGSPTRLSLLCHHRSSSVGVGIINLRQTRPPIVPNSLHARLSSSMKLRHTNDEATRDRMLRRWVTWSRYSNFRPKQINRHFDLRLVCSILDEVIFDGVLGNCVVLRWGALTGKPDWSSRTIVADTKRGPRLLIVVMKPLAKGTWTNAIMQGRLEALLYAMTEVVFLMHRYSRVPFQPSNDLAEHGQRSGKRSSLKKMLRDVEQQANQWLRLPKRWNLRRG